MLYCAYGSNMNLDQMAYRCPKSNVVGNGKIYGWELVFNVHADIIKSDKDSFVPVVVWDIDDDDWAMLDMYEGYPDYYIRIGVNVEFDDGNNDVAIVYVMADNRKGICPPAQYYFDCIEQGYIDNGIDTDCLYDALEYSYDNETEHNQYTL